MTNTKNNERGNLSREVNSLDGINITNNTNNDNAFSESGLENYRLLNEALKPEKPK